MQYLLVMLIPVQFKSSNVHPNELCHKNHLVPARCEEWINDHCARKAAHQVDQKKCNDAVLIDDPDPVALFTSTGMKRNVLYHKIFVEPVRCEEWINDHLARKVAHQVNQKKCHEAVLVYDPFL